MSVTPGSQPRTLTGRGFWGVRSARMHFARGRTGESADADACAALGADEFKVRLSSQKADEAYCTEDLGDALATGLAMVA